MPSTPSPMAAGARPRFELADIFRKHGDDYRRRHAASRQQWRVMHAIEACRTADLGGHLEYCEACGFHRISYNSCRNRHCPKCQPLARAQWLADREAELLPVPYFHLVFTLPHEFNTLVLAHRWVMLTLLFHAVSRTLLQFAANNLGGRPSFTLILHTWDQKLGLHVHLHSVITGGVLSFDGHRWIASSPRFLFPVRGLSRVFRGKFLDGLDRMGRRGRLPLSSEQREMLDALRRKEWVVYAKPPFGGPRQVLKYLGRYTHRIAISNERIIDVNEGRVSFFWRDRRRGDVRRIITLEAGEFIRRFLLHVIPHRFVRIRHYGVLASRGKRDALRQCREALEVDEPPALEKRSAVQWMLDIAGVDITRCPKCGTSPLLRVDLDDLSPRDLAWMQAGAGCGRAPPYQAACPN